MLTNSTRPLGNSRTSSGLPKLLSSTASPRVFARVCACACVMAVSCVDGAAIVAPRRARRNGEHCVLLVEIGEDFVGDRLEARDLAVGARDHHRSLERTDQRLRRLRGAPL